MATTESKTFYPGMYENMSGGSSDLVSNAIGKGSDNIDYALFRGIDGIITMYWPFDVSAIPVGATIDSVLCKFKAYVHNTTYTSEATGTLTSGTTIKSSAVSFKNGTAQVYSIPGQTFTRNELDAVKLKITYGNTSTTTTSNRRNFYFFGADLIVSYTYQEEKFMMKLGSEPVKLPDGYTRLAYIESTGAQAINWGFNPTNETRITSKFQFTKKLSAFQSVFGSRGAGSAYAGRFCFHLTANGTFRSDYNNANVEFSSSIDALAWHTVDKNRNTCAVDSTSVSHAAGTFTGGYSMYLFAENTAGMVGEYTNLRMAFARAYEGGYLIRDCYPVTNASGVAGMYDVKNGVFYPSETTTPFVAGPVYTGDWHDIARVFKKVNGIWVEQTELASVVDQTKRLVNGGEYVVELPEGYTRLQHIESDENQYIDTAFLPNQDTRVVCKAVFSPESKAKFLFGARTSATSDQFMFAATSGGVYRSGYGSEYSQFADTYSSDGIIIVDKNKATTALTLPDGTNGTVQGTESIFATPCSVVLFAVNNNGSVDSLSKAKLYSCQIYDNGDLIRDYIPCTNASGTVGLYDKVTGVFYSSATSTPFISGPELGGSGGGSSPNLISFTIAGESYQAEEGMTWAEWVASSYNTKDFQISGGFVWLDGVENVAWDDEYVGVNDVIVAGRAYYLD